MRNAVLVRLSKMNSVVLIGTLVFCMLVMSVQSMPSEMHTEDAYAADGYFHRAYNNGYKQGVKDSQRGHNSQGRPEGSFHKPHPLHPQQYYHPEVQFNKPNKRTEYLVQKDNHGFEKAHRNFENRIKP